MKRFATLLAIIVIVVLGWFATWTWLAGRIKSELATLAAAEPSLVCQQLDIGGFPFRFDIDCHGFALAFEDMVLALPKLQVTALVYRPTHLIAFAQSPARLSDAFLGTERQLSWSSLQASLRLDNWQLSRFSLHAEDLSAADSLLEETVLATAGQAEVHLVHAETPASPEGQTALAVFARLTDAEMPAYAITGAQGELDALVTGLPADPRNWTDSTVLRVWQNNAGMLTLNRLALTSPGLAADLSGQGRLDENGLLNAEFTLRSTGLAERLQPLVEPPYDTLITGTQHADGSRSQTYRVDSGVLSAGSIALMQLAPLF